MHRGGLREGGLATGRGEIIDSEGTDIKGLSGNIPGDKCAMAGLWTETAEPRFNSCQQLK